MIGKRSIVFSNTWYSSHNNCLVVSDTSNLTQKKIKDFVNKNINIKYIEKENIKFINYLGDKFIYADLWPRLPSPKNLNKITFNFFRKISEII